MSSIIIGLGAYLPSKVVTNHDLSNLVDTTDEWITSRTGIQKRHLADKNENTSDMAYQAAYEAVLSSQISYELFDLIIVCTNTADNTFPSVANKIQHKLQETFKTNNNIPSFDLQAVCSGFIYGLDVAHAMLTSKKYQNILLVCADKMSSIIDWKDRNTCVLFGDGAGAITLHNNHKPSQGIIDSIINSDGALGYALYTSGGIATTQTSGTIKMIGKTVFTQACEKMIKVVKNILERNSINIEDIDYFIPHQANLRIIKYIGNYLKLPDSKVVITVDQHANCSAASIPLALYELNKNEKLKGKLCLFVAFGAGATWGGALVRF